MAFDSTTRNKLAKFVSEARNLLVSEFGEQLQEVYGIRLDGTVLPLDKLDYLTDAERAKASLLRGQIDHILGGMAGTGGSKAAEAVDRIIREQAFTLFNRFCALRMAEERDLVQECVGGGFQSKGFRVFETVAGTGIGKIYDRYKTFLFSLFDEINLDLGVLFDRFSHMGMLFPRESAVKTLFGLMNDSELTALWSEDETIGWVYQYWNSKEERDAMRKASRSPRNTREMAVRNQFFTPRYVVEFLADNTLGRIWYEMRQGDTTFKEECRYIVIRPNEVFLAPGERAPVASESETNVSQEKLLKKSVHIEHRHKKDPRDLRVLDPACGSGHFLLYAFDLLESIYQEAWEDPQSPKSEPTGCTLREDFETLDDLRRAVPKLIIERNLHGIDIDSRAVQIAALVLWLRAQKAWKNTGIKAVERPRIDRSNIVTAEPMLGEECMRSEFTASLKPRVLGQLVDVVFEKMKLAGELGSLLKIEEEIKDAVAEAKKQWIQGPKFEQTKLFPELAKSEPYQQQMRFDLTGVTDDRFWEQAEDRILNSLKGYSERAENSHEMRRRLFAEDAARGFAFIDLCRNRYDAILMNPPFGASSRKSKEYIEDRYPKTKGDVLANFIERTLDLTDEKGRVGAISSRTPFFLGSFETLRAEVFGKMGHVRLLADLGEGVLEAMVETAIYVMTKHKRGEPESLFFRLLIDTEKGELLQQLTQECLDASVSDRIFVINPGHFERLRGNPYAYWVSTSTIETIGKHPRIEGNKGAIRVGLQTSNDWRFLRLVWEIPNRRICTGDSAVAKKQDQFVLNIRDQFKEADRQWAFFSKTEKASPWFSPLTLVIDWTTDGKLLEEFVRSLGYSPSRLIKSVEFYFRPGFSYMLRSTRLVPYLVPSGVMPTAGRAQIFPEQGEEYAVLGICASNVGSAVARFSGEMFARPKFQASIVQGLPACDFPEETLALIKEHVDAEVNKRRSVVQRYEPFQEFTLPAWIQTTEGGQTVWDLYSLFGRGLENKIAVAFGLDSEQLGELERDIREAVSIRGRSEEIEFEDAVEDSSENAQELKIELISETAEERAVGLFTYAIGVVFGRWDVRIALNPSLAPKLPDPFDPLPVCPPAMLLGPDSLPAESGRIVSEEWLRARPDANTLPPDGTVNNLTVPDDGYPLRVSWEGILVDDPGFNGGQSRRDDIVGRVREVLDLLWKDKSNEIEQEACDILGISDLQDYLRRPAGFFQDHLKRYSKNRRQAPIYWPLSAEPGSHTLWIYYHRLDNQILFKCVSIVELKIKEVGDDIDHLKKEMDDSGNKKHGAELEKLLDFRQELIDFKNELLRVAKFYKPDLNDGVIINAAPLWKLFRLKKWQKTCKDCWDKLEAGEYDWSHMAMNLHPDKVREKCKSDKSLAIAHGLEELYVEPENPKKKGKRKKKKA